MWVSYKSHVLDMLNFSNQLILACRNAMEGFQRMSKDAWSSFVSVYEAPLEGYQPSIVLAINCTTDKILQQEEINSAGYLVFRVRTVVDEKGHIVRARYGKIYGPVEYGENLTTSNGLMRFTYYLNPTDNDRNLEFDPARNLFPESESTRVNIP